MTCPEETESTKGGCRGGGENGVDETTTKRVRSEGNRVPGIQEFKEGIRMT